MVVVVVMRGLVLALAAEETDGDEGDEKQHAGQTISREMAL